MEISTKDLSDSLTPKDSRPQIEKKSFMENSNSSTMHWFAQLGEQNAIEATNRDREEKLRITKERQNEERQRKIEELRIQAEAAQRFREQKDEERRRRIEELRTRDNEKRQQVEERKKAILEAEKERKEYIIRKNQERDVRMNTKHRNEKSQIIFAFGSSTPRLLDPAELGSISPSTYLGHRRSTSISNVAYSGASLTRRSSERELSDGSKKRATSASGIERHNDDCHRMSTSMYEVFNWGYENPTNRYSLSLAGGEIDIDEPILRKEYPKEIKRKFSEETAVDSSAIIFRSVARRKTDLMPTIPSPREPNFGSKTSLYSHTPRTPGRAVSMSRLDQLAQPVRRNGEHIRAIIERQKLQQQLEQEQQEYEKNNLLNSPNHKNKSRSMTHLIGTNKPNYQHNSKQFANNNDGSLRPLRKADTCKSMSQLLPSSRIVSSTKKFLSRFTKVDKKLDEINSSESGSRSGNVTPGGSINNTSRPGSAMSTSTTTSGLVQKRTPLSSAPRKPRPASIAGTGVSLDDIKQQKKEKPPLPKVQSTPKRTSLNNSTTTVPRVASAERKSLSVIKKEPSPQQKTNADAIKNVSSKTISKTIVNKNENVDEKMTSSIVKETINTEIIEVQTKDEKNALNAGKTELLDDEINTNIVEIKTVTDNGNCDEIVKNIITETIVTTVTTSVSNDEIVDEKIDKETEKEMKSDYPRELSAERQENEMTASMIARSIRTEEEAKAALAERRKFAREEAERQAELERQRLEAERQAELKRLAEEEERQRLFEEESTRLAEAQRKAEEERLQQAIEEAKKKDEEERLRKEEDEKSKAEKEESEKKAREEAEKQRLEVAERLKREEKEREERRKRVEAIMSRTRKPGAGNATPNSTPVKENNDTKVDNKSDEKIIDDEINTANSDNQQLKDSDTSSPDNEDNGDDRTVLEENIKILTYEQSVTDKENALMKNFSNLITDQNVKNLQNNIQNAFVEVTNGKLIEQNQINDIVTHTISNGNGHIETFNNKNEINSLIDVSSDQLINFGNESQHINDAVNFNNNNNNNNSLLTTQTTTSLVIADGQESKDISLL